MEIPKEALALHGAASTEPSRYQLTGVYFTRNGPLDPSNGSGHQLEACATDGKQLTRLRWKDRNGETKSYGKFGVILSTADCKQLQKCCNKSTEYLRISEAEHVDDKASVFVNSGAQDVEPISGDFPKYGFVLEKGSEYDRIALVDPFILRNQLDVICKALGWTKHGQNRAHHVRLHIARPGKGRKTVDEPLIMEASEGLLSVDGAVMPIVENKNNKV